MSFACLVVAICWFCWDVMRGRPKRAFAVSYCVGGAGILLGHWGL